MTECCPKEDKEPVYIYSPLPTTTARNECQFCRTSIENGTPLVCFGCGVFLVCELCLHGPLAIYNEIECFKLHFCLCCMGDFHEYSDLHAGEVLQRLLRTNPSGRHVNYARLILALCKTGDDPRLGVSQDIDAARTELLRLANDEEYALAQYVVAALHRKSCPRNDFFGSFMNGSLFFLQAFHLVSPFHPCAEIAKSYLERAAAQKHIKAMVDAGVREWRRILRDGQSSRCKHVSRT